MKQHTEASIKKNYIGSKISRRTAKKQLSFIYPDSGDKVTDSKLAEKRNAIVSGWIRDKQAVNNTPKRDKKAA